MPSICPTIHSIRWSTIRTQPYHLGRLHKYSSISMLNHPIPENQVNQVNLSHFRLPFMSLLSLIYHTPDPFHLSKNSLYGLVQFLKINLTQAYFIYLHHLILDHPIQSESSHAYIGRRRKWSGRLNQWKNFTWVLFSSCFVFNFCEESLDDLL